jgi:hypothetical protein
MSEDRTDCEACGEQNTLNKIPEVPIYLKSNTAGKVVKQHIEDAKQQVREDKEQMKKIQGDFTYYFFDRFRRFKRTFALVH